MQAYEAFGANVEGVQHLNLPLTAFYKLAAPSTPESAREEVIERAAEGETLSHAAVQEIIAKAKAEECKAANVSTAWR